ncbi:hypothetical protein Tco_0994639, partial [Tanacetum coccineum]
MSHDATGWSSRKVSDNLKGQRTIDTGLVYSRGKYILPSIFYDINEFILVFHLPKEAIQGGPIYMRWMYPFERYMKKLKNYVRNKAKAKGSIAEGYVADEALTFCSMYLEDIETRFNRPDKNGDTSISDVLVTSHELSVFESVCSPIRKRTTITFNDEEYKKVEWYVLNNSPEIASYMNDFSTENPPTQLRSEFPRWFKTKITRLVATNKSRCSDDLLALAHRPEVFANSYTRCTVNGVRFTVHTRDQHRSTQNSGISTDGHDGTTYYGQLKEILELIYTGGRNVVMFRCKWFDTGISGRKSRCVTKNNITNISVRNEWCKDDQYILATHANKVFYLEDPSNNENWRVVQQAYHRKIWHREAIEPDVIHDQNSCDISLFANLDDITHTRLSRAGQSTEVDNIQASVSDDDDFIVDGDEDEDVLVIDSDIDGSESDNNQCEGERYGKITTKKLLPFDFDSHDGETWKLIGTYAHQFTTTISLKIGDGNKIPFYFDTWAKVEDRNLAKRKHAENAIDAICGECYRYHKYKFKRDEFVKKDGFKHPDVLRAKPPGNMPIDEWNRHIDFFLQPDQIKKSETNSKNRSKQTYPSVQGTRKNDASRYSR